MKTKSARRCATAMLAAITLVALQAATGAAADNDKEKQPPTIADCQGAWELSHAYPDCGDRSNAPGSTAETIEMSGTECLITTGCEYKEGEHTLRGHSSWIGSPAQTERVQVCLQGKLDLGC